MSPWPAAATKAYSRRACATCTGTAASPRFSAVALDALALNGWSDLDAADGERLRTLLRPPVSTAATARARAPLRRPSPSSRCVR